MTTQDQMIAELNTLIRLKIAPSKIEGVGVFAMRDIPMGTKLYTEITPRVYKIPYGSISKLFPDIKQILLERWPQIINSSPFAWPTERMQAFMNHSTDPNYDAMTDVTLRDIKKDEEVTEDYTKIPSWEKVFPWLVKQNNEDIVK